VHPRSYLSSSDSNDAIIYFGLKPFFSAPQGLASASLSANLAKVDLACQYEIDDFDGLEDGWAIEARERPEALLCMYYL
jgi:hypothetical protein